MSDRQDTETGGNVVKVAMLAREIDTKKFALYEMLERIHMDRQYEGLGHGGFAGFVENHLGISRREAHGNGRAMRRLKLLACDNEALWDRLRALGFTRARLIADNASIAGLAAAIEMAETMTPREFARAIRKTSKRG